MMKKWTQAELDATRADLAGGLDVGTGDFSECNFWGRSNVTIGPNSILAPGTQLGDSCKIGDNCQIGAGFSCRQFCQIGEYCHFGEDAHIGFGSRIGCGCCFASGCVIEREVWIMEGVQLPRVCTVYGVENVDGKTMIRIGPIFGRQMFAFRAEGTDGKMRVWAGGTALQTKEIRDFIAYVRDMARRTDFRHCETNKMWKSVEIAAGYIDSYYASGLI